MEGRGSFHSNGASAVPELSDNTTPLQGDALVLLKHIERLMDIKIAERERARARIPSPALRGGSPSGHAAPEPRRSRRHSVVSQRSQRSEASQHNMDELHGQVGHAVHLDADGRIHLHEEDDEPRADLLQGNSMMIGVGGEHDNAWPTTQTWQTHCMRGEMTPSEIPSIATPRDPGYIDKFHEKVDERRIEVMETQHRSRITRVMLKVEIATFFAFALSCLGLLLLWVFDHDNAEVYITSFFVTGIAAATYLAKCTHMGDWHVAGVMVPVARYLDWITTTPLMLYELCHLAHAKTSTVVFIVGCDILMLSCGMIAAVISWTRHKKLKHAWFCMALAFYGLMLTSLHVDVAKKAEQQSQQVQDLFFYLEYLTVCTWTFYPVVVLIGRAHLGIISRAMEDILLCLLDVFSKIGMDCFIVAMCVRGCLDKSEDGH